MTRSPPRAWLPRLQQTWGVDFHVFLTLLFRGWTVIAGGVTVLLLPVWLDPIQQGYYFTFSSLLALQVLFELGLSGVVIQLVSHEAAHLVFRDDGTVEGDERHIARLNALVHLIRRWYGIAALLFVPCGIAVGWAFFGRQGTLPVAAWGGVWTLLVVATAANLVIIPRLATLEGLGRVGQVARLRLVQSLVGFGALWVLLAAGAGLWAALAVPLASALLSAAWLRHHGWTLATPPGAGAAGALVDWRRDVWPLQWRIAVSWTSGFFILHLFTPAVFANHGEIEAGRLGLAMTVFGAISTVGMSWINAKAPDFTMHIARGESRTLNRLFLGVALRSTAFTFVLAFTLVLVAALGARAGLDVLGRVATPWTLFWLACATVFNVMISAGAAYMRAHREEPMVPVSVVSALCVVAAILFAAGESVSTTMALYAAICGFVGLPWTLVLSRRYLARHVA
jgi:hypothetical protein